MHEPDSPFALHTRFRCAGLRCWRNASIDGGYCGMRCSPDRVDDGPCDWCGATMEFDAGRNTDIYPGLRLCEGCYEQHREEQAEYEENDGWRRYCRDHGSLSAAERNPGLLR